MCVGGVLLLVSCDRRRTICELEATYGDTVREAYHQARHPFDRVWVANILVSKGRESLTLMGLGLMNCSLFQPLCGIERSPSEVT
ncbi:hypothetical protein [Allocoleopsis franciscana]|uniref:Uncharacterized protein n=1 Tax=Allocoleopsis franciscana PCC 7113 TaxID=1173027 RepID=K9WA05_9CYAN|nr:hypothetical protein [Allocoleopsis franciscana]AFZ16352.1 hypothetical protein Mic7113_0433 [Allocoleopsis franciscana PCC 7113]